VDLISLTSGSDRSSFEVLFLRFFNLYLPYQIEKFIFKTLYNNTSKI
jgi:hypothetical protein